ncbi:MAG: endolytic transglycosylase MltG [Dehalococcoidia bacterium]
MRFLPPAGILLAFVMVGVAIWQITETPGSVLDEEPPTVLPTATPGESVIISIQAGESAQEVGDRLEDEGIISSGLLFRVLVALQGYENKLVAGDYEFDKGMPTLAVIERIIRGQTAPLVVTIREGLRAEEIAELMEAKKVLSAEHFMEAIDQWYEFSLLYTKPYWANLEGYLFPDTYFFNRNMTAEEVVQQILENLDQHFDSELRQEAAVAGLSVHTVLTLASIVEREAQVPEERPIIADVFLKRLRRGMPLEADPTVQYALGNDPASVAKYGYWKQELTQADLEVDSPYNTYRNVGLPRGPICNPGLDSIKAVIAPAQTDYLYFVARADGSHVFAETLEEHLRNIEQYRGR